MKNTLYKFLINWYQASDKPLPHWLERACERDAGLATEKDLGDVLTRELQKRPNGTTPIAGDSMAARVLRQITEEDYLAEQETANRPAWAGWLKPATAVAAACAVVIIALQLNVDNSTNGDLPVPAGQGDLASTVQDIELPELSEDLLDIEKNWKNPLDQEFEYMLSDAKGALNFLATNFVPSGYLKKGSSEENA